MCTSKAEGGQRCFTEAKDRYDRALSNLRLGGDAHEAFLEAETELASTPQGEEFLARQRDVALAEKNSDLAQGLSISIERGLALRERNAAVKDAVQAAATTRDLREALKTMPPPDIDERLAALYEQAHENSVALDRAMTSLRYAVGDRRTGYGRTQRWGMTFNDVLAKAREVASGADYRARDAQRALAAYEQADTERDAIREAHKPLNDEFARRGGWTRAFLVTNDNGHVHKGMDCSTCEPTTRYSWQTAYSGMDETAIVEAAGELACTRCFPSAPAEVLNRPTQMTTPERQAREAAREERAAAKIERERKKIEKALTADGSEFTVTYGPGQWDRERFKTEMAATSWAVGKIVDHGPGSYRAERGVGMDPGLAQAIQEVKEAIATKHGWTLDQVNEHLEKKAHAKRKRDGMI